MALNKTTLGLDLKNRAEAFNETDIVDLDAARLQFWTTIAEGIIEHFKNNGVLTVPGAGMTAGATPVTGTSTTGTLS